jgi:hypothetical protein
MILPGWIRTLSPQFRTNRKGGKSTNIAEAHITRRDTTMLKLFTVASSNITFSNLKSVLELNVGNISQSGSFVKTL